METTLSAGGELDPVLLCDATWYGTLAAVWDLGSRGVPVTLASDALTAPARWSRFTRRTVRCPPSKDPAFPAWLLEFGRQAPGHVLYPTSDELAWYVASNREELAKSYKVFSPPLDALVRVLDKAMLAEHGRRAGLDVPETWCPWDEAEVERLGRELRFPVFVKPRAQVMSQGAGKGVRVGSAAALVEAWRAARAATRYAEEVKRAIPGVELLILQACHPGSERIYTVDGFIDPTGEHFACLACTKLLQRPRQTGPGILFEHSPLDPALAEGLRRLCRSTGFYGVFDAEFVELGDRRLFIDFNPRFYNHMAFEVDRGLPLPWLAYLSGRGDREALASAVSQAQAAAPGPRAFVHSQHVALLLTFQALGRAMPRHARLRWRSWIASHDGNVSDPVRRRGDRGAELASIAMELSGFVRHPRSYLRGLVRGVR
jgi:predicted ATP-grasp superfamily ATP-dependent carboligase